MTQSDYITILSPMVTKLKLSGNALIIFALIHGFTKDGEHLFHGSLDYISKWVNISRQAVIANLKSLVEKGYIEKLERIENGVKFCFYRTNYDELTGSQETLLPINKLEQGSQGSLPNNNIYNDRIDTPTRERFVKPTIEEVREYCLSRHNNVDPVKFWNFYEAKGWKIGNNHMKNWKACVVTWEGRSDYRVSSRPAQQQEDIEKLLKFPSMALQEE